MSLTQENSKQGLEKRTGQHVPEPQAKDVVRAIPDKSNPTQ